MNRDTSFRNPFGLLNGKLFLIDQIVRGDRAKYTCPACHATLIVKMGHVRRSHFAHHPGSNCNPESIIHKAAKYGLRDRIQKAINEHCKILFTWSCQKCHALNSGDLVRRAHSVEVEEHLGDCRPDIVVHDNDGNPVLFVEIDHKHSPEENVYEHARIGKIGVVTFKISDEQGVMRLLNDEPLEAFSATPCKQAACRNAPISVNVPVDTKPPTPVPGIPPVISRLTPPTVLPSKRFTVTEAVFGLCAVLTIWIIIRGILEVFFK